MPTYEHYLDYIDKLCGDDNVFKKKMVAIIKKELPLEIDVYHKSMEVRDYRLASEHVHKLKHKIGVLGMTNSYVLAETFEHSLRDGGTENQAEFESVLETVKVFIDQL